jgi:hypothetical protein
MGAPILVQHCVLVVRCGLASRPERRVCLEQDPVLAAVFPQIMLWQQRMKLDLVHSRYNGPGFAELLEVGDRPICNSNGTDFA